MSQDGVWFLIIILSVVAFTHCLLQPSNHEKMVKNFIIKNKLGSNRYTYIYNILICIYKQYPRLKDEYLLDISYYIHKEEMFLYDCFTETSDFIKELDFSFKEDNDYYIFKNNIKYTKEKHTIGHAIILNWTLENCENLIDSQHCKDCKDSYNLIICFKCYDCFNLKLCYSLVECTNCEYCGSLYCEEKKHDINNCSYIIRDNVKGWIRHIYKPRSINFIYK